MQQFDEKQEHLLQQYLVMLKRNEKDSSFLQQKMGELFRGWQQGPERHVSPPSVESKRELVELRDHPIQLQQNKMFDQQLQQFLMSQLDKSQVLQSSQREPQEQLKPLESQQISLLQQQQQLEPQQTPLLEQHPLEGGLRLGGAALTQKSPRQQPRPSSTQQQQQRPEARAKRKLRTPSAGSLTPHASAAPVTPADPMQQQLLSEEASTSYEKQLHALEHQLPPRRQQQSQQEKPTDMGRRLAPLSSSGETLLCRTSEDIRRTNTADVTGETVVDANVCKLDERSVTTASAAAEASAAYASEQLQRKGGVRNNTGKTTRVVQQRQQQRSNRAHRQQQRQPRQQGKQQIARRSPSPTRGRPGGGQRYDFLKASTYSGTTAVIGVGAEAVPGVTSTDRKGSAGNGRPNLWSPEAGGGVNSSGNTVPIGGIVVQQQTPQRMLQQQHLAILQQHQHPHDQHARHGTYGIVARGVRERLKSRTDSETVAAAALGAGESGDISTTAPAGGRRGKHCRSALVQSMRGDRPYVCLSCKYRDPFLTLSPDQLEVTGHKVCGAPPFLEVCCGGEPELDSDTA